MDAYGQPFAHPGLVTNMSVSGLVVQGVKRRIREGEILDVRMGDDKAQFRVVWVGDNENVEMGLQRVTAHTFVAHSVLTHCSQAAAAC
jgi:cytochrome c-type biogenesis protein CcmE